MRQMESASKRFDNTWKNECGCQFYTAITPSKTGFEIKKRQEKRDGQNTVRLPWQYAAICHQTLVNTAFAVEETPNLDHI